MERELVTQYRQHGQWDEDLDREITELRAMLDASRGIKRASKPRVRRPGTPAAPDAADGEEGPGG
jgi:hypothetical protein